MKKITLLIALALFFSFNAEYSADSFVLQKDDEQMMRPNPMSFRKDLMLYFSDCPELSQKIESKEFRSSEIVQMVKFYNANCAKGLVSRE